MKLQKIKVKQKDGTIEEIPKVFFDNCIHLYPSGDMYASVFQEYLQVVSTKTELEEMGIKFDNK